MKTDNPIATRMHDIEPFHVMDILARAKQLEASGKTIIHMEIGEPDFSTPKNIIDAAKQAMDEGLTHYTPAVGIPSLRQAIADEYMRRYGVQVTSDNVIITPGASGALMLILGILINPGEQVLMADPGYPCNRHFVRLLEGQTIAVPVGVETQYQLSLDTVKQYWTETSKVVLLASPSNPTGTLIADQELQAIVEFVQQQNGFVIVDEIYHALIYDALIGGVPPRSAVGMADNVFVISSFSKYFSMTGWRLGWLVAPSSLDDKNSIDRNIVRNIDKLAQNIYLAPPTISQLAAIEAFSDESRRIFEQRKHEFKQRRDYLLPALRDLGFDITVEPQGAFYLYANISKFATDSYQFANQLLEQAGVAITPGIDFGQHLPEQHVRFAYTTSLESLKEGVKRIARFLKSNE